METAMQVPDDSARKQACRIRDRVCLLAILIVVIFSNRSEAQWAGKDGWVEEPAAKSLNVEGKPGHAYLDPASVRRGDDGLIYFNESSDVSRPEDIGKVGGGNFCRVFGKVTDGHA